MNQIRIFECYQDEAQDIAEEINKYSEEYKVSPVHTSTVLSGIAMKIVVIFEPLLIINKI